MSMPCYFYSLLLFCLFQDPLSRGVGGRLGSVWAKISEVLQIANLCTSTVHCVWYVVDSYLGRGCKGFTLDHRPFMESLWLGQL